MFYTTLFALFRSINIDSTHALKLLTQKFWKEPFFHHNLSDLMSVKVARTRRVIIIIQKLYFQFNSLEILMVKISFYKKSIQIVNFKILSHAKIKTKKSFGL